MDEGAYMGEDAGILGLGEEWTSKRCTIIIPNFVFKFSDLIISKRSWSIDASIKAHAIRISSTYGSPDIGPHMEAQIIGRTSTADYPS